jgi:prophage regulatory protein
VEIMAEIINAVKDALLKRQELERASGLGKSAIYARMDSNHPQYDPTFPKPVAIGGTQEKPTAVRWVASEVDAWIHARIAARDNRHTGVA